MTVDGIINGGVFCPDFGDITLQGVTADYVLVDFAIKDMGGTTVSTFSETYHPDAAGKIYIKGLSDAMEAYLGGASLASIYNPDSMVKDIGGYADCEMVFHHGETTQTATQRFYQSRNRTQLYPSSYKYFLNRFRERSVYTEQLITVSYIYRSQTLKCKVAYYNSSGESCLKTISLSNSGCTAGHIICHQYKPSYLAGQANVGVANLIYLTMELYDGGSMIDYMKFTFDRTAPDRIGILFKNAFGVPEHIIFSGRDKHTAELDGSFAWVGRKYRKMHTDLTTMHTICTGWVDEDTHDSIKDAICSDEVYLVNNFDLGDQVTVTDIDLDYEKPRTEPLRAFITYRVSDRVQESFSRVRQRAERVFDDTFDHTYN